MNNINIKKKKEEERKEENVGSKTEATSATVYFPLWVMAELNVYKKKKYLIQISLNYKLKM